MPGDWPIHEESQGRKKGSVHEQANVTGMIESGDAVVNVAA